MESKYKSFYYAIVIYRVLIESIFIYDQSMAVSFNTL